MTCSGTMVDIKGDPANCGGCGVTCPAGQTCAAGACTPTCVTGYATCTNGSGAYCANTNIDSNNCGSCGAACDPGKVCASGSCVLNCSSGMSACPTTGTPTYCANLQTDSKNCGSCGTTCSGGTQCNAGNCNCNFTQISAGGTNTCGLKADGTVTCWGAYVDYFVNTTSPFWRAAPSGYATPTNVGISYISKVVGGSDFTCAIQSNPNDVLCWGGNNQGELGQGSTLGVGKVNMTPTAVKAPDAGTNPGLTNVVQLGAGVQHACALTNGGSILCWGSNGSGQLGTGSTSGSQPLPVAVVPGSMSGVTKLAAGRAHTCAIDGSGSVWCWGENGSGQCGIGNTTTPQLNPVKITSPAGFTGLVSIVSNGDHTCAVKGSDGTVWCWGRNSNGECGDGTTTSPKTSPGSVLVAAATSLTGAVEVAVGAAGTRSNSHSGESCARKNDGTIWCWGYNARWQLGVANPDGGSPVNSAYAAQIPNFNVDVPGTTGQASLTMGHLYGCAVKTDGTVWCWGSDLQAGTAFTDFGDRATPTLISKCGS